MVVDSHRLRNTNLLETARCLYYCTQIYQIEVKASVSFLALLRGRQDLDDAKAKVRWRNTNYIAWQSASGNKSEFT